MEKNGVFQTTSPMGQGDVIVIDDNYTGMQAKVHETAGAKIEQIMRDYVSAIKDLIDDGGLEGQTADKLYEFAETAEQLLRNVASEIGIKKKKYMENFLEEIDIADEEIY